MEFIQIILILITGILAGFLNVMAGGGSLLTMPVLIFLGLPSAVANGTNRIALTVQNIVAILNFRKNGYFDWKFSLMLGIPALIGSILGANLAISLPDEVFNKILAIIMVIVLIITLWQPHKKIQAAREYRSLKRNLMAMFVFFFVGVYGGFVQAGVGFIIIASLVIITGLPLVKINSIKVFVVLIYMLSSLTIFIVNNQIDWSLGFTLAIGNGIGGWLGSKIAMDKGDKWIRIFLVITVTLMAIKLFT
ncbi:integrase [Vulcanibacillus modesticaldus]|uniref:Probable membrane transporter protein n=1 Tax=Vulcanibacillus modesticaldus TaxID=337097 RepID=A0A1D2YWW8_9BACI|nr:sulfite exporter TauE/SafE family protein [Vulcanibacillus modesticaldus]OEG00156.1 integrase [Vulcanibacillus modesticaldus]